MFIISSCLGRVSSREQSVEALVNWLLENEGGMMSDSSSESEFSCADSEDEMMGAMASRGSSARHG